MKRLLLTVAVWIGLTGAAWSRTVEEQIFDSLEAQGYVILEHGYTFLGRLRIVAENGEIHREIVVNPGTGEILRDYAISLPKVATRAPSSRNGAASLATATATATATDPGTTMGTVAGVAGSTGAVKAGDLGTAATQGDQPTLTDGLTSEDGSRTPQIILVDPLLPYSAGDQ